MEMGHALFYWCVHTSHYSGEPDVLLSSLASWCLTLVAIPWHVACCFFQGPVRVFQNTVQISTQHLFSEHKLRVACMLTIGQVITSADRRDPKLNLYSPLFCYIKNCLPNAGITAHLAISWIINIINYNIPAYLCCTRLGCSILHVFLMSNHTGCHAPLQFED